MKIAVVAIVMLFVITLSGCNERSDARSSVKCSVYESRVVAFRVAKHSRLWLENVKSGRIHEMSGLGGRREPAFDLGHSLAIQYCGGNMAGDYSFLGKPPVNSDTRFFALRGYEYLNPSYRPPVCPFFAVRTVRLVGYRVAEHSVLWMEDAETKQIHESTGIDDFREPAMELGALISAQFCNGTLGLNERLLVRRAVDHEARVVLLAGYEYLDQ